MDNNGWQPIETAPKYEAIWCWLPDWKMQCVAWFDEDEWWSPVRRDARMAIPDPTHWRPLPEPPE